MSDNGSAPRDNVLEISDFRLAFRVRGRDREAIRGVSFSIGKDESVGLVGESGCGKSTIAFATVKYLPQNAKILSGSIRVAGEDVFRMHEAELQALRSTTVSMVYQSPGSALNPSMRIGEQVTEVFRITGLASSAAAKAAMESLERVQISDPVRPPALGRHAAASGHRYGAGQEPFAVDP